MDSIYQNSNIKIYKTNNPADIVELCGNNIFIELTKPNFKNPYYTYRFNNNRSYTLYVVKTQNDTFILHISKDKQSFAVSLKDNTTNYYDLSTLLNNFPVLNQEIINKLPVSDLTKNEVYIIKLHNAFPNAKIPAENEYINLLLSTEDGCKVLIDSYASLSDDIFNKIFNDYDHKELTDHSLIKRYIDLAGSKLTENQLSKIKSKLDKKELLKVKIKFFLNICKTYNLILKKEKNNIYSVTHNEYKDQKKSDIPYVDYDDIKYSGINIRILNCNFRVKNHELHDNLTSLNLNQFVINKDLILDCPNIKSLKGCPESVGRNLDLSDSKSILSFEFAPKNIGGGFDCRGNKYIQFLTGVPLYIHGDFNCTRCINIKTLKGGPESVDGNFKCYRCNSLENLIGSPRIVKGYFSCSGCENLKTLQGAPTKVLKNFYCEDCPKLISMDGISNSKIDGFIFKPEHLKKHEKITGVHPYVPTPLNPDF